MKKKLKYIIPFLMAFLLMPMINASAIGGIETQGSEQSWGISIGDKKEFTIGWGLELDLSDSAWDMLEDFVQAGEFLPENMSTDVRGHYLNFSQIDQVYNFEVEITNITNYLDIFIVNSTYDRIYGNITIKEAHMDNYGPVNATLIYEIQQNAAMFDAYLKMMGAPFNTNELIEELTEYGPETIRYEQSWYNTYNNTPTNVPDSTPLFVPTDWDMTPFYNDIYDDIDYTELQPFIFAANWGDLTSQFGISKLNVNAKEVDIKFKLSSMNATLRDQFIGAMNLNFSGTLVNTWDELLTFLDISALGIESNVHLQWDRKGVLLNSHVDFTAEGVYNGEIFRIKGIFDISQGEHTRINAKYTVPGYSTALIVLVGLVSVGGIIWGIKKKKF